jgi:hypothetical protein
MPEKKTMERARQDKREGKAPSTQAGEFVREEIHHVREGKHGAKSTKQAIAIGLSKARRSGVKLPAKGRAAGSRKSRSTGKRTSRRVSSKRSRATKRALERMPHKAASSKALSRQAKTVAHRRSKADRSRAAKKAARTRKRTKKA